MKTIDATAVYDGRTYLGEVERLGNGQHRASTANGISLGLYATAAGATDALLRLRGAA